MYGHFILRSSWLLALDLGQGWSKGRDGHWHESLHATLEQFAHIVRVCALEDGTKMKKVNEEYVMKGTFIERLLDSLRDSIGSCLGSRKSATVQHLALHDPSLPKLQTGSRNTNAPQHKEKSEIQCWNSECKGGHASNVESTTSSSTEPSCKTPSYWRSWPTAMAIGPHTINNA